MIGDIAGPDRLTGEPQHDAVKPIVRWWESSSGTSLVRERPAVEVPRARGGAQEWWRRP